MFAALLLLRNHTHPMPPSMPDPCTLCPTHSTGETTASSDPSENNSTATPAGRSPPQGPWNTGSSESNPELTLTCKTFSTARRAPWVRRRAHGKRLCVQRLLPPALRIPRQKNTVPPLRQGRARGTLFYPRTRHRSVSRLHDSQMGSRNCVWTLRSNTGTREVCLLQSTAATRQTTPFLLLATRQTTGYQKTPWGPNGGTRGTPTSNATLAPAP